MHSKGSKQIWADVLHVDEFKLPRLYVKQHAEADSFAYAPEGAHPCIVLTSRLVELLTPLELQCELASQLCMLRDPSMIGGSVLRKHLSTVATIAAFAPELLPSSDPITVAGGSQATCHVIKQWKRFSHLTGDRASMCVLRDERVTLLHMPCVEGLPLCFVILWTRPFTRRSLRVALVAALFRFPQPDRGRLA